MTIDDQEVPNPIWEGFLRICEVEHLTDGVPNEENKEDWEPWLRVYWYGFVAGYNFKDNKS